MAISRDTLARNLGSVRARIEAAARRAGRNPGDIRLVAVTKSAGVSEIAALIELGVEHFGENRVEIALEKIKALGRVPQWHMIGNVQRRKVRDIVRIFQYIDAIDRNAVVDAIEQRCAAAGIRMPVLIEVNVSGEAAKHGYAPEDVPAACDRVRSARSLILRGLLTMAPEGDPEMARPVFRALRGLGKALGLETLSMGMSNDFEVAIEEGATEVRIGSLLFIQG